MDRRQRTVAALIGLSVIVLGWGIWRVAPHQFNADEWSVVGKSLHLLYHDPIQPEFRKGGNLHDRVVSMAFAALSVYWLLTGQLGTMIEGSAPFGSTIPLEPGPVLDGLHQAALVGRGVSVLAGVGTVYLVYVLTRDVSSWRAGVVAGLALVSAPGFVTISKFATEDAPQIFLVVLTLFLLIRAVGDANRRLLALGAVTTGLAVSMKATSGFLLLPLGMAVYEVEKPENGSARHWVETGGFHAALAALGYFATTPAALIYPKEWAVAITSYIGLSITRTPMTTDGVTYADPGLIATINYVRSMGFFLAALAALAAGITIAGIHRDRYDRRLVLLAAFAVPYALVLTTPRMPQYPRLMLLHPMLAVGVGIVIDDGLKRLSRSPQPRDLVPGIAAILACVLIVLTGVSTAVFVADFGTSRAEATDWLTENVETGDEIDAYGYRVYLPEAPAGAVVHRPLLNDPTDETPAIEAGERVDARCPEYVVLSSFYYGRFLNQPSQFEHATLLMHKLLYGESGYSTVARFGPPVLDDYSFRAKFWRSFNYPPKWLWGTANPTVIVMERDEPPRAGC